MKHRVFRTRYTTHHKYLRFLSTRSTQPESIIAHHPKNTIKTQNYSRRKEFSLLNNKPQLDTESRDDSIKQQRYGNTKTHNRLQKQPTPITHGHFYYKMGHKLS